MFSIGFGLFLIHTKAFAALPIISEQPWWCCCPSNLSFVCKYRNCYCIYLTYFLFFHSFKSFRMSLGVKLDRRWTTQRSVTTTETDGHQHSATNQNVTKYTWTIIMIKIPYPNPPFIYLFVLFIYQWRTDLEMLPYSNVRTYYICVVTYSLISIQLCWCFITSTTF